MHLKNHGGIAAMRDAARDYNTSSQTSPVDSPQVLTAARVDPTKLPPPYPTTPTTSYYSPPTLWPAFRIIVDESAAGRPGETSNDQIRPVTSAAFPSLAQARKKRTLGCVCGCRGDASGDIKMLGYLVRVFYDYSSPTRASLGLGTYALRPQRDIAHGERASCKTLS